MFLIFNFNSFFVLRNYINLGIGDWGLGIGDWGLGPIPNPQSPIPMGEYIINIFIILYKILYKF